MQIIQEHVLFEIFEAGGCKFAPRDKDLQILKKKMKNRNSHIPAGLL
jgi:hypothetical protein